MSISTHVLDASTGTPAVGVGVRLSLIDPTGADVLVATARTDSDGRVPGLTDGPTAPGTYRLVFETAGHFARTGTATFYPEVVVTFIAGAGPAHLHIPLLLSPFAYSTYRGS